MPVQVKIERMEAPLYQGDWHDPPFKWRAIGPGDEKPLFFTRDNARLYAKFRRRAPNAAVAEEQYVRAVI